MTARYSQCDSTCTVDCGHCKGNEPPQEKTVYVPGYQLNHLNLWLKRWDRWMALCDALRAAQEKYGEQSDAYRMAYENWSHGKAPSKAAKHRAYDNADAVRRYLNAHKGYDIERGSDVAYLRHVCGTAIAAGVPQH
jgi:hypothetical protein